MSNKLSSRFENKKKIEPEIILENEVSIDNETKDVETKIEQNESKDIENNIKNSLEEKIQNIPIWFEYTKEQQSELIKRFVANKTNDEIRISNEQKDDLVNQLIESLSNFGAIQYLIDNQKVQSITVNSTKSIYIEIENKILNTDTNLTETQLTFLINSLKSISKIDNFKGITHALINNFIITVISDDICKSGINIRIQKIQKIDKDYIIQNNIMTDEIFDFILSIINLRKNILISGCNSTFKTKLINTLLAYLSDKRVCLIEINNEIQTDFNTLAKFQINDNCQITDLITQIKNQKPEYIVSDLNSINTELIEEFGTIMTIRENSIENVLKNLIGKYMQTGLPEKFAKSKALSNIDYIIHFENTEFGTKLYNIVELKPSKTMQTSVKSVVKLTDDGYYTDIPQPITSMRAKSLRKS